MHQETNQTDSNSSQCTHTHTIEGGFFIVRKDGAEIRRQRIEEVAKLVMSSLKGESSIILSKTLSLIMQKTGLTRERTMEYLEILRDLNLFEINTGTNKIEKACT